MEEQTGTPRVHRRLEALSGNDGTTIWQLELPAEPFLLSPEEGIPQPFRFLVGPNFSRSATGGFSMPMHWFVQRRPAAVELEGDAIYVQGRIERLPGDGGLALAAGSQLLIVDPQNGEWREGDQDEQRTEWLLRYEPWLRLLARPEIDSRFQSKSSSSDAVQQTLLARVLDRLPDDYREVLVLRNVENLPHHEVALRMNRTEGAVWMLWVRALGRLREAYLELQGSAE